MEKEMKVEIDDTELGQHSGEDIDEVIEEHDDEFESTSKKLEI